MKPTRQRQFKGTSKKREFYDRKVMLEGRTRALSLGRFIPRTWGIVRIEALKKTQKSVTLKITLLMERNNVAPTKKNSKRRKRKS